MADTAPTDILLSSDTVMENSPADTVVGTLVAVDPDPEVGHVFLLAPGEGDDDNGSFQIVDNRLLLAEYVKYDYEETPEASWHISIMVIDPTGRTFRKSFVILLTNDTGEDRDGDGLSEAEEELHGTDPDLYDTDGDGVGDGAEVAAGTSPTEPGSWPQSSIIGWGKRNDGELMVPQEGMFHSLSTSEDHSLALDASGGVIGWGGMNSYDQNTLPDGIEDVVAVAAGGDHWEDDSAHSLVLKADGTVHVWGYNPDGKMTPPAGLDRVVQIDAGRAHAVALRDDGTVAAWGYNPVGAIEAPPELTDVVTVAAGGFQCLALKADGTVVAWGNTFDGKQWVPSSVPVGLCDVIGISAGRFHSMAVRCDGSVVAWGYNSHGQTAVPAELIDAVQVAAGGFHSLALNRNGDLVAWGMNNHGQADVPAAVKAGAISAGLLHSLAVRDDAGHPVITSPPCIAANPGAEIQHQILVENPGATPLEFSAMGLPEGLVIDPSTGWISGIVNTPVRRSVRIAVKTDKGVIGQAAWIGVSQGSAPTNITLIPAEVVENSPAGTVVGTLVAADPDAGDSHTYEWVDGSGGTDNHLFRISNDQIVLDADLERDFENNPVEFSIRLRARDSSLNPHEQVLSIRLLDDRTEDADGDGLSEAFEEDVYQTSDIIEDSDGDGFSDGFEVANGTLPTSDDSMPGGRLLLSWGGGDGVVGVPMPEELGNVFDVAAGVGHSLALRSDGSVLGWGADDHGQASPPEGLQNLSAVSAGGSHSLGLRRDGTVAAWGSDLSGQCSVPPGLTGVVAIAAGGSHSLALRGDGTVAAWGGDDYGQATPPAGLDDVVTIAAGGHHSLALRSDGSVVAWGGISEYEATVAQTLAGVIAIAAGGHHSLALRHDGSVIAWGSPASRQTFVPAGLGEVVAIAAGAAHSLALRSDGTLVTWGDDSEGQVKLPLEAAQIRRISAGGSHNLAIRQSDGFPGFEDLSPLRGWPGESVNRLFTVRNAAATGFSALGLPPGLTIDSASGTVTGEVTIGHRRAARIIADTDQGRLSHVIWCNTADGVAPTQLTLSASQIRENSRMGTIVGHLSTVDPNAGDHHSFRVLYSPGVPDNRFFMISGKWLIVRHQLDVDYDAGRRQVFIRLGVVDSGGNEFARDFSLDLLDDRTEDGDGDGLSQQEEEELLGSSDKIFNDFNSHDPDHDGVPSLLELAFNLDPDVPAAPRPLTPGATSGLPVVRMAESGQGQSRLRIEYLRRDGSGMNCIPQFAGSLNPADWAPAGNPPAVTPLGEGWEYCVVEDTMDTTQAARRFGRVLVRYTGLDRGMDGDDDGVSLAMEEDVFGTSDAWFDDFSVSDVDRDGIPAMIEYAFNLDPAVASPRLTLTEDGLAVVGLPLIRAVADGEGRWRLRVEYLRRRNGMVHCTPQFSGNLESGGWVSADPVSVQTTAIDADWERCVVFDPQSSADAPVRFARVLVSW